MENIELNRKTKGLWIPIEIWEDKNLNWNEKILFLEIDSFTSKDNDCFISNKYISNLLGVSETSANKILSSLIKKGYVIKTNFDGRRRFVKSALSFTTSQGCDLQQGCIEVCNNIPNIDNNIDNFKEDTNVSKKDENNSDIKSNIDELYKMYPSKCPKRNISLGKCFKDKERLKKLLKNHSYEMLKFTIEKEISEKYNKSYMSNFSTFLNNLPDYGYNDNKSNEEIIDEKETKDNGNLVINGIVYR